MVQKFKDAGINLKGWIDSQGLSKEFKIPEIDLTNCKPVAYALLFILWALFSG